MTRPGWYSSPQQADAQQYWDGEGWTERTRPIPEAPPVFQTPAQQTINVQPKTVKRATRIVARIVAGALLFAGGIPLLIAGPALVPLFDGSEASRVETMGTVVAFDYSTSSSRKGKSRSTSCAAIAEFEVDGATHRAKADIYTSPCKWVKGETVDLSYDPKNPASTGVVERDGGTNIVFAIVAGVGAALFATGIGVLVWSFRKTGAGKDKPKSKVKHPSEFINDGAKKPERTKKPKRNKRMDMNGS